MSFDATEGDKDALGKRKDKKDRGYKQFEPEDSDEERVKSAEEPRSKVKKRKASLFLPKKSKDKEDSRKEEKDKNKERKPKGKKGKAAAELIDADEPIFGVPLAVAVERNRSHDGVQLPAIFRECIDHIEEHGLTCEGIYRISGVKSKVQALKDTYNRHKPVCLTEHEPNVVASLLKQYLRELPEPVLTHGLMPKFESASTIKHPQKRVEYFKQLMASLPVCNRLLVSWMMVHMQHIIAKERHNKMTLQNVSIVLSPTMQISHRVLNVFFLHWKDLFRDTKIKKYVPPIKPASSKWSLDLPETPGALEEELNKQESLLNQLHEDLNKGVSDTSKEEQIWEVQRVVTQLKRELKNAKKAASVISASKSLEAQAVPVKQVPPIKLAPPVKSPVKKRFSDEIELKFDLQKPADKRSSKEMAVKVGEKVEEKPEEKKDGQDKRVRAKVRDEAVRELKQEEIESPRVENVEREQSKRAKTKVLEPTEMLPKDDKEEVVGKTDHDGANNDQKPVGKTVSVVEKPAELSQKEEEDINVIAEGRAEATDVKIAESKDSAVESVDFIAIHREPKEKSDSEDNSPKRGSTEKSPKRDSVEKSPKKDSPGRTMKRDSSNDFEIEGYSSKQKPVAQPAQSPESNEFDSETKDTSASQYTQLDEESGDSDEELSQSTQQPAAMAILQPQILHDHNTSERAGTSQSDEFFAGQTGVKGQPDGEKIFDINTFELVDKGQGDQPLEKPDDGLQQLERDKQALLLEEEELLLIGDELRQKIETERIEIGRLQQEIDEANMLRSDDSSYDTSDTIDTSSESENEEDTEDLQRVLDRLTAENERLEKENADLCRKTHEEKQICLAVKVQIRMLQQQQQAMIERNLIEI